MKTRELMLGLVLGIIGTLTGVLLAVMFSSLHLEQGGIYWLLLHCVVMLLVAIGTNVIAIVSLHQQSPTKQSILGSFIGPVMLFQCALPISANIGLLITMQSILPLVAAGHDYLASMAIHLFVDIPSCVVLTLVPYYFTPR